MVPFSRALLLQLLTLITKVVFGRNISNLITVFQGLFLLLSFPWLDEENDSIDVIYSINTIVLLIANAICCTETSFQAAVKEKNVSHEHCQEKELVTFSSELIDRLKP